MYQTISYYISASFLVPAYNLPKGVLSHYITTVRGNNVHGDIAIDVWLVNALREQPKESMIASLKTEETNFQSELDKALAEEKPAENGQKSPKVYKLEQGKELFSNLVNQANNAVYQKTPDEEFMKIAKGNLLYGGFAQYQPDLNNYLYLAGLSRFEAR